MADEVEDPGEGLAASRGNRWLLVALLAGVLLTPIGWLGSDALERNNDFCNACHLPAKTSPGGGIGESVPLHIDIRRDFEQRPAASLAALHAARMPDARQADPEMRCIDCHGGVGLVGRARVKALAAKDAFFWVIGRFEEPDSMLYPLWDRDCRKCHAEFRPDPGGPAPGREPFHALGVHNTGLGIRCVTCHTAHEPGGRTDFYFLHPEQVKGQCGRCHSEFERS